MPVSSRPITQRVADARSELGPSRTKPSWLEKQHSLPFDSLSGDEFEILVYLVLREEHPDEEIFYYGKTKDSGRDIVRSKPEGMEVIQCKNYSSNVGVPEVRREIANLVVNVWRAVVPKVEAVVFYVACDLTPQALDFISQRQQWINSCEKILSEHLGKQPDAELLSFAKSWWPKLSHISGTLLTQRLRTRLHLIEEFFGVQKVITGSAEGINDRLDVLVGIQNSHASEALTQLLRDAESRLPGLHMSVESSSEGSHLVVRPKAGAASTPIGDLQFPDSDSGISGRLKYERLLNEGIEAELGPGEFVWTSVVDAFWPGPPADQRKLLIRNSLPQNSVPACVELLNSQGLVIQTIPFSNFRLKRVGRLVLEFEIHGGRFAGKVSIESRTDGPSQLTFHLDFCNADPELALESLEFMGGMGPDAELRVVSLQLGTPLIVAGGVGAGLSLDIFKRPRELLEALVIVNRALKTNLRYPTDPNALDFRNIEVIAAAITHRCPIRPRFWPSSIVLAGDKNTPLISELLDHLDVAVGKDISLDFHPTYADQELPVGPAHIALQFARLRRTAETIRSEANGTQTDVQVEIVFDGVHCVFENWDEDAC